MAATNTGLGHSTLGVTPCRRWCTPSSRRISIEYHQRLERARQRHHERRSIMSGGLAGLEHENTSNLVELIFKLPSARARTVCMCKPPNILETMVSNSLSEDPV